MPCWVPELFLFLFRNLLKDYKELRDLRAMRNTQGYK